MYSGFNLDGNIYLADYEITGKANVKKVKEDVQLNLKNNILNGIIDGTKLQNDWFPTVNADVFISHSHDDEKLALGLAGWLYSKFKLTSFIDSFIWGYSNDLLKIIDDKYCYQESTETYNYEKRNFSTSHIHMILSTALFKMVDKTECIIFLNTDNSICSAGDTIKNKTFSPWIYSELISTELVRKKPLSDYRKKHVINKFANESASIEKSLKISYDVPLDHLININRTTLNIWLDNYNKMSTQHPLDALYFTTMPEKFKMDSLNHLN